MRRRCVRARRALTAGLVCEAYGHVCRAAAAHRGRAERQEQQRRGREARTCGARAATGPAGAHGCRHWRKGPLAGRGEYPPVRLPSSAGCVGWRRLGTRNAGRGPSGAADGSDRGRLVRLQQQAQRVGRPAGSARGQRGRKRAPSMPLCSLKCLQPVSPGTPNRGTDAASKSHAEWKSGSPV